MDKANITLWDELDEAIELGDYKPTDWECEFLKSIRGKVNQMTSLQSAKLNEIHAKVFP